MAARLAPVHPGEVLREEFMKPHNLNPHRLSLVLRVSAPAIYELVGEERAVSTDMALRLARCFDTTPEFWLNLQTRYDLEIARSKGQKKVEREVQRIVAVA